MAPNIVTKGEAALQDKLNQIKLDYLSLVNGINIKNVKAAEDLEKKFKKDKDDFEARQEMERREFESRMLREKEEFEQKHKFERSLSDKEAIERLKQAEDFIDNVKSPLGNEEVATLDIGKELECPVCFEEMKPPVHIWQCSQGHLVCQTCKTRPEVRHCPTCRQEIVGRATVVEKIAAQIHSDKDNIVATEVHDTTASPVPCTSRLRRMRLPAPLPRMRTSYGNDLIRAMRDDWDQVVDDEFSVARSRFRFLRRELE
eukprot:GFUD01021175.1.p1 GENE.GFUD01021175.1~~GFUD01021175.1.p1  ORF type:complete len:258 (+),score=74.93 GFUD01021175.1:182-955(+)